MRLAIGFFVLALAALAAAQSITDLGPGSANGISRNGRFVVLSTGKLYDGVAKTFTTVPKLAGASGTFLTAVSDNGTVVGNDAFPSASHAFKWSKADGIQDLGFLAGDDTRSRTAYGVSSDGSVVVGECHNKPFRWTAGTGMVQLGTGAGGFDFAFGVSADGSVVVGSINRHPFRWTQAGGVVMLPEFGFGGNFNEGRAVSSDGSIVVGDCFDGVQAQMYRWKSYTGAESLLGVSSSSNATASGVSDDGKIVVGTADLTGVLWFEGLGGFDARTLLIFQGVSSAQNWQALRFLAGISADGSTFCGEGKINNVFDAFVATIAVPSPSTAPDMHAFLSPTPRVGGDPLAMVVTLSGPAPIGTKIPVQSLDPELTFKNSALFGGAPGIIVPPGAVASDTTGATVSLSKAKLVHAMVRYNALGQFPSAMLVPADIYQPTLAQSTVVGGTSTRCTVKLNGLAPPGDALVGLTSSDPSVTVPIGVTIVAGTTSAVAQVNTSAVTSTKQVTITARYLGRSQSVVLTVTP